MAGAIKYLRVNVVTKNEKEAGTDAAIYIGFCLSHPKSSSLSGGPIYRLPDLPGDDNNPGDTVTYDIKLANGPQLDQVTGMVLINGMNNDEPGWLVEKIWIEAWDETDHRYLIVKHDLNRWLQTAKQRAPVAILRLCYDPLAGVPEAHGDPINGIANPMPGT